MYIFWVKFIPYVLNWKQFKTVIENKLVENVLIYKPVSFLAFTELKEANDND